MPTTNYSRTLGKKRYEMTNHLGNVLATISDRKLPVDDNADNTIDYYTADAINAQMYYAFGAPLEGKTWKVTGAEGYRYGFNGQEKEPDVNGDDYDYGARIYDARIERWLSGDPHSSKFPDFSPYNFAYNIPILIVDNDGKEGIIIAGGVDIGHKDADAYKFINAALGAYERMRQEGFGNQTLVPLTANMTSQQIADVQTYVATINKVTCEKLELVIANSADEVVNYLNSKSTSNPNFTEERRDDQVTHLSIYGHGLIGHLQFGYDGNPEKKSEAEKSCDFGKAQIDKLKSEAFAGGNSLIELYNCNTSTTYNDKGNSFAKDLSFQTQTFVNGFVGKTDYKNIYGFMNKLERYLFGPITPAANETKGGFENDNRGKQSHKESFYKGKKL